MQIIQTCAAGYVLFVGIVAVVLWLKYVATGKKMTATITGFPAFVWFVATLICAVTTLANIN